MFYVICPSFEIRSQLIEFLKENNVQAVFHYLSLHKSEFNKKHAKEILIFQWQISIQIVC